MQYQPTLGKINYAPSEVAQQRVDPGQAMRGGQGASQLLGQLNRAQWADWKNRFAPYVDELARVSQDSSAPGAAATNASNAVGLAYDSSQQGLEQQRQGFGISQTPQQQAADATGQGAGYFGGF